MFSSRDVAPHPLLAAAAPTREQFDNCVHNPVYITTNPLVADQRLQGVSAPSDCVPFNSTEGPFTFETDLMSGVFDVRIHGLASTRPEWFASSNGTRGRQPFVHVAIQGRLKRDVRAADLLMGHEFPEVPGWVPKAFTAMLYTGAAKMFASTVAVSAEADPATGTLAGFMTPALASCTRAHVAPGPDHAPPLWEAPEDCSLLEPSLLPRSSSSTTTTTSSSSSDGAAAAASEARRKFFDDPEAAARCTLRAGQVLTTHSAQHFCEFSTYRMHLPAVGSVGLLQFSTGCPLQIMAKDVGSGLYAINLLIWHKNLLYRQRGAARADAPAPADAAPAGRSADQPAKRSLAQRLRNNLKGFSSIV